MNCCDFDFATEASGKPAQPGWSELEEQKLRLAAKDLGGGMLQSDFLVPDMHCAACIARVERGLDALSFVSHARVNLSAKRVSVTWKGREGSAGRLMQAISGLGYDVSPFDLEEAGQAVDDTGRRLLTSLGVAGFAAANIMLLSVSVWSGADGTTGTLFHMISGLIAAPAVAYAGQPFFRSALRALAARHLNMDVPISLAVLLALGMSFFEAFTGGENAYFDASVTLLFFLLIGRYLDHRMRDKARGAVSRLSRIAAKGATVIHDDGGLNYMPASEIEPGMRLALAAGERVPVDGRVVSGDSTLDRSLVTGESEPVTVAAGTQVEAGTLNLTGPLVIEATKTADRSFLAEVAEMMAAAEQGKARYVRIADRLARIYAPAVHLLALATFIGWLAWTGGDWRMSVYAAIAVLIITCPCALGLAVPIVHVVGANRLFTRGVMVKDGAAFEKLSAVDTVVFDKTGTLTLGTPSVTGSERIDASTRPVAAALAAASAHPYAKAVARHLAGEAAVTGLSGMTEIPGLGIEATMSGKPVRLGRRDWVMEIAGRGGVPDADGSEVAFAVGGRPASLFRLSDTLRPDARETVRALLSAGLEVEILSGDHERPVREAAERLGIAGWHHGMTPGGKVAHIAALQDAGRKVLVVGDGLNDAPALAAGYVSIAPSSGSDVGRLAADAVFTGDSLSAVALARDTALATGRLVRQNFAIAFAYNLVAIPLAVSGQVTPLVAAIAMSASSIAVVANSMRLNFAALGVARPPRPAARRTGAPMAVPAAAGRR